MSLKKKLIRLAYERPNLRPKIVPILAEQERLRVAAEKATKVTFMQAVLDRPEQLKEWVMSQSGVPSMTGWDFKCHHMTLEFFGGKGNASSLEPYAEYLGNSYVLDITGIAFDEYCCAVVLDTKLPVKKKHPHITIAVNGVKPSYSNELLENGISLPVKGKVRVTVGYFDGRGGGDKFEFPHDYKG